MADSQEKSTFRGFVKGILFWYAFALIIYMLLRWVIPLDWSLLMLVHTGALYLFLPVLIGLVIALLLRAPRLVGFYLVLTVIGLIWFAPRLLPPLNQPEQIGTSIKLVSFNVFPENIRLNQVSEWLLEQDADVIALQEIGEALPSLIDTYPYYESQGFANGQALYSRYPIIISEAIQLADTPHQRLLLDINGQRIVLYNVHLYMPLNDDESQFLLLRYDESRRNQQINELTTFVASENYPVIIAGDFNMSEFSPMYSRLLTRTQLHDAFRATSGGLGLTFPDGAAEELDDNLPLLFRLDYVWYTGGIQALDATVGSSLGSDHLPLVVTLDVLP